jgi:hypothetical protein
LLFTLKNLLMIIYVFKKHEIFLKTMKIVEFFLFIWGKLSELEPEPEPEFLTSWSRSWSRTKMDRLRNTAVKSFSGGSITADSRKNLPKNSCPAGSIHSTMGAVFKISIYKD